MPGDFHNVAKDWLLPSKTGLARLRKQGLDIGEVLLITDGETRLSSAINLSGALTEHRLAGNLG